MDVDKEFNFVMELDTTGLFCPEPLFQLRDTLEKLKPGDVFKVLADDPAAEEDIHRWAKRTGNQILNFRKDGILLTFIIKKKE